MGNRTISANTRNQTGRHRSNTWRYLPSIACQICILSIFTIPYIQHPFQWAGSALLVSRNEFLRLQMDVRRDACRIPRGCRRQKSGSAQTVLIVSWQGIDSPLSKDSAYFTFFQKNPLCIFLDDWCGSVPSEGKYLIPPVLACPNALSTSATCSCKRINHFRDPCSIFLLFSAEVPARRIYKIAV